MTSQATRTLLLAVCVLAAGIGAWMLSQEEVVVPDGPEARELQGSTPRGGRTRETPPSFGGSEEPASPTVGEAADGVPRILPPDAAIEDIRDALALEGAAQRSALRRAYVDTARLAAGSERTRVSLRRRIDDLGDARVRGIATAALGADPSDDNRRTLRLTLREGPDIETRIGALIALARPSSESLEVAPTASATLLGSLEYEYAPLSEESRLLTAMARFLDSVDGVDVRDALPIVTASVKASPVYATLLAADGKEACRWYRTLAREDRDALRAHAMRHSQLLPEVRRVLKETK